MLKLKDICKEYKMDELTVHALDNINLEFRKNEFVSVLGPSGCGKTTLLNIIGGLDRYTSGDLYINSTSTKNYKDKDWDSYRNYSIGFIFQSYNLIPHQTVLENVELALTLANVSKKERRARAIEVLEKVGLKDQIKKKPTQMSGGQVQRVAIARALINNPDIILADEPTGALDSETSLQIMELLKKISEDKLIIMVTHNPELAEKYSSRIIHLLDGKVIMDTAEYHEEDNLSMDELLHKRKEQKEKIRAKKTKSKIKSKKVSLKFITALSLSLRNLLTKKFRTILTAFAGSIGIVGIALILSLASGVNDYVTKIEKNTLSTYPIELTESTVDMTSMFLTGSASNENNPYKENAIYSENVMTNMLSTLSQQVSKNNLKAFKEYLEKNPNDAIADIMYGYNLKMNIYRKAEENKISQVYPGTVMDSLSMPMASSPMSSMTSMEVFIKVPNMDRLKNYGNYELIAGAWPKSENELMLVVDKNGKIFDYTLYTLGLLDQSELKTMLEKLYKNEEFEVKSVGFEYEDLLNLDLKLLTSVDYYSKVDGAWKNLEKDVDFIASQYENGITLKISGILKVTDDNTTSSIIYYSEALDNLIIDRVNNSEIIKEQLENKEINVFTGEEFKAGIDLNSPEYANLTDEQKAYLASLSVSNSETIEKNLETLGYVDKAAPTSIKLYPQDFEAKDEIKSMIDKYNEAKRAEGKDSDVISYTDIVGAMMASVTSVVNIISYVLIAFVSISLVVSSIMIGIITYISVLERTKEIGILRSLGASKRDISKVFKSETLIIGITAGLIGIGITLLLLIPINNIVYSLTDIASLATLHPYAAIALVAISASLTLIAGLMPAKYAANKDPVEALRVE